MDWWLPEKITLSFNKLDVNFRVFGIDFFISLYFNPLWFNSVFRRFFLNEKTGFNFLMQQESDLFVCKIIAFNADLRI